ncbi:MAG TPA: DUF3459 domain-containing protein, partial [Acidimicrobiales bacterium]
PFVYQGDELGLEDAVIPEDRAVDPGGRDGCRALLAWDGSPDHGWPVAEGVTHWLPLAPEAESRNRAAQRADPHSILHLYRRALAARKAMPALALGSFERVPSPDGTLAYRRRLGDEACTVLVNFTGDVIAVPVPGLDGADMLLQSDDPDPVGGFSGVLGPDQAVVLAR